MKPFWLPEALYHRFFNMPAEVEVIIDPSLHWLGGPCRFLPLRQRVLTDFAGYEAVDCGDGVTIHFLHDTTHPERPWENRSAEGALQSSASLNGLVWRNEIYELQQGPPWFYEAPSFGLTFGGRNISVLIELADDYPVLPDAYRQFLRYTRDDQGQAQPRDFASLVRKHMPDWVRAIATKGDDGRLMTRSVIQEMSSLASRLGLAQLGDTGQGSEATDDAAVPQASEWDAEVSQAAPFAQSRRACGIEPVMLRDGSDIRDRWLEGRAAVFYPETKQLFVNLTYESVIRFQADLLEAALDLGEQKMLPAYAREVAEVIFVRRLMRAVLFAIAKNLNPVNWQDGHVDKAMSPEALSIVGDDFADVMAEGLAALRERVAEAETAMASMIPQPKAVALPPLSGLTTVAPKAKKSRVKRKISPSVA
jgi:hypothetical protein